MASELNIEVGESAIFGGLDLALPSNSDNVELRVSESNSPAGDHWGRRAFGLLRNRASGLAGVALLLALWELAPRLGWIDNQFFVPLSGVLRAAAEMAATGELFIHIVVSLGRTLGGLLGAVLVAIPLGFLLGGWFPRLTRFFQPLLHTFGQVNAFSLFPIFVLFFGIGELAKFSVICWSCLWPLLFGTVVSVRSIDPLLIKTARSMNCDGPTFVKEVLWPAALPAIMTAVRIGAMVSFLMLIAAEMIGANRGLGRLVLNATINYQMPRVYLAATTTAVLGLALQYGLNALERRLVHWKPSSTPA